MSEHGTYLVYELAWALPVIAVQWAVAWRELWRWRRLLTVSALLATLYLGACDAFALGHGIWQVDPRRVLGLYAGPLPLEEFVFYFVTNIMAAQGFVMLTGYLRERKPSSKKSSGSETRKFLGKDDGHPAHNKDI